MSKLIRECIKSRKNYLLELQIGVEDNGVFTGLYIKNNHKIYINKGKVFNYNLSDLEERLKDSDPIWESILAYIKEMSFSEVDKISYSKLTSYDLIISNFYGEDFYFSSKNTKINPFKGGIPKECLAWIPKATNIINEIDVNASIHKSLLKLEKFLLICSEYENTELDLKVTSLLENYGLQKI